MKKVNEIQKNFLYSPIINKYAFYSNYPFKRISSYFTEKKDNYFDWKAKSFINKVNIKQDYIKNPNYFFILEIPDILIINILKYLSFKSLIRMIKCHKKFKILLKKSVVWKWKLKKDFNINLKFPNSNYYLTYKYFIQSNILRYVAYIIGDESKLNQKFWFLSSFLYDRECPYPSMSYLCSYTATNVFGFNEYFLERNYVQLLDEYLISYQQSRILSNQVINPNISIIKRSYLSQDIYGHQFLLFPIREQCQQFIWIDAPSFVDLLYHPFDNSILFIYKWNILHLMLRLLLNIRQISLEQHIIKKCENSQNSMNSNFQIYYETAIFIRKIASKCVIKKEFKYINYFYNKVLYNFTFYKYFRMIEIIQLLSILKLVTV